MCPYNSLIVLLATGERTSPRNSLVNKVPRSSEVSVVRILHPEWMFSLTKTRKWALLKLSQVPLEPRDQPLCGNYLLHNTHDLMQSSQQLWREISHPLTLFDGEGTGNPLQYSCLENPMDSGAWEAVVHGVAKSQTWLSDFAFTFHFPALEKEMATHSSVLAWRIPGTGKPGGLPSLGSHRVGHDWSDSAAV